VLEQQTPPPVCARCRAARSPCSTLQWAPTVQPRSAWMTQPQQCQWTLTSRRPVRAKLPRTAVPTTWSSCAAPQRQPTWTRRWCRDRDAGAALRPRVALDSLGFAQQRHPWLHGSLAQMRPQGDHPTRRLPSWTRTGAQRHAAVRAQLPPPERPRGERSTCPSPCAPAERPSWQLRPPVTPRRWTQVALQAQSRRESARAPRAACCTTGLPLLNVRCPAPATRRRWPLCRHRSRVDAPAALERALLGLLEPHRPHPGVCVQGWQTRAGARTPRQGAWGHRRQAPQRRHRRPPGLGPSSEARRWARDRRW
jgi:hypothetical protein